MNPCAALLRPLCVALALIAAPALAGAPAWKPEGNVELIVPTAAGSGSDRTGRLIQSLLQEKNWLSAP